jgi:hypothetical protein
MIIYEVNLTIDGSVRRRFLHWLDRHVREILAIEGFLGAEIHERTPDDREPSGKLLLTVHYRLRDKASLRRYLSRFAPALRADAVQRFGRAYTATRRILILRRNIRSKRVSRGTARARNSER